MSELLDMQLGERDGRSAILAVDKRDRVVAWLPAYFGLDSQAISRTGSQILTALLGVDGAGSLLDADLLDGSHANAFSASGHTHALADLGAVPSGRTIGTQAPLSGGGTLANDLTISLGLGNGLEVASSQLAVKLESNSGLALGAQGLSVACGNGLEVNTSYLRIDLNSKSGLALGAQGLSVAVGDGLEITAITDLLTLDIGAQSGLIITNGEVGCYYRTNGGIVVYGDGAGVSVYIGAQEPSPVVKGQMWLEP